MCSYIFKLWFKSKSKQENNEPDPNTFGNRAVQEENRRLLNIDEAKPSCSSNSYFSYDNLRSRRPLSKLSEGKQSLEKPAVKHDEEKKDESKKFMGKETHAMFMLEEDYQRRHAASDEEDVFEWTV